MMAQSFQYLEFSKTKSKIDLKWDNLARTSNMSLI